MIIDIPPHLETAIIEKAQMQGISTSELLEQVFMSDLAEIHGLNAHALPALSDDELQAIYDDLDDDTPNLALQALIKRYGGLNA